MAPTVLESDSQGYQRQPSGPLSAILTYVLHSAWFQQARCYLAIAFTSVVLAVFFGYLHKRLGSIKINMTIDRPQRQMAAEEAGDEKVNS